MAGEQLPAIPKSFKSTKYLDYGEKVRIWDLMLILVGPVAM
jgi:hypothetical protein